MNYSDATTLAPFRGQIGGTRTMTTSAVDEQMVTFAYRWMPFGGSADDDIFAEFGLTPVQFYLRVIEIVESGEVRGVVAPSHHRFIKYCHRRLREHMATGRR